MNCYNNAIICYFRVLEFFCKNNKQIFLSGLSYGRLDMGSRKNYLKRCFDETAEHIYKGLTELVIPKYEKMAESGTLSDKDKSDYERFKKALEVAKVIKSGLDRSEYSSDCESIRPKKELMCCFLHKDETPSMNYVTGINQGFYCFACSERGKVIDVFGLIDLISQWEGKGSLRFVEQMTVAVDLFVNGEVEESPTSPSKDFVKYSGAMVKTMYSKHMNLVKVKNDDVALDYLMDRGISQYTATRLGVMSQYPTSDVSGNLIGRAFLVFINSDGSYAKRLFKEDKQMLATRKYVSPCSKWTNKANSEVGVFNGQIIEHCQSNGEVLFICEGAFDCLSCEELGFHAVAINGVSHAVHFMERYIKGTNIKCVCLSDFDSAGKQMAQTLSAYNQVYVPEFYTKEDSGNILTKYKDVNECLVADKVTTHKALAELQGKANKHFGY